MTREMGAVQAHGPHFVFVPAPADDLLKLWLHAARSIHKSARPAVQDT